MTSIDETVSAICAAPTLDARSAEIRKIASRHGTDDWPAIYAQVARELYVPHLTPDFAYVHEMDFYGPAHFADSYRDAAAATHDFTLVDDETLQTCLSSNPKTLLTFRVIAGLTRDEFAHATKLVDPTSPVTAGVVDGAERRGTALSEAKRTVIAATITRILDGTLFGHGTAELRSKQDLKPDTEHGWNSVAEFAKSGVPYWLFLHQRHYGGAFRQLLDATSTRRGDLIEDAVADLFTSNGVPFLRTGSNNQGDIATQFGLEVRPAPDFVVFDQNTHTLLAMLECKGANDGGTARDKAARFRGLKTESMRLGGIPVMAVLSGIGWQRVNDTLGPVLRDTDGRVFTMTTLDQILTAAPLPQLIGTANTIR